MMSPHSDMEMDVLKVLSLSLKYEQKIYQLQFNIDQLETKLVSSCLYLLFKILFPIKIIIYFTLSKYCLIKLQYIKFNIFKII